MEVTHKYRVVAWWSSGRTGIAKSDSAPNAIQFTAPVAFGGLEGRWTPEDLLLGSVASCFTTTFQAVAAYSKFEYTDLEVEVEGIVSKVALGEADAGFVYATDAKPVASRTKVVLLPTWAQPSIRYQIAVVSSSSHKVAARAFVRRVTSARGRQLLKRAGFGLLPKKR